MYSKGTACHSNFLSAAACEVIYRMGKPLHENIRDCMPRKSKPLIERALKTSGKHILGLVLTAIDCKRYNLHKTNDSVSAASLSVVCCS